MACGYGACYGCVVEVDGALEAALRRRAGAVLLLNASGCLDALTAPERARQLDAFVTKTVTPEPREGNPPVRIAETDLGMLNAIGLANPGRERFLAETLPALRDARLPLWVSVGGFSARRLRRDVRGARGRDDRAEPLVPERRRGARVGGGDRRRLPRGDRAAALREALARRLGHRRGRACGRGGGRRRALPRQHDPRPRARRASPPALARGDRRLLGPGAEADRARRRVRVPAGDARCRSSAWAASGPDATRSSWSRAARRTSRSERCSSRDPDAPSRVRAELARERRRRPVSTTPRRCRSARHTKPCSYRWKPGQTMPVARAREVVRCRPHGAAPVAGSGSRPFAGPAHGGTQKGKRHSGQAGAAEEGSEVRARLDRADPPRPAGVRLDREGVRHADGGAEVRPREGGAPAQPVPDQPVEDGRRPVRPSAPRADWPLQPS